MASSTLLRASGVFNPSEGIGYYGNRRTSTRCSLVAWWRRITKPDRRDSSEQAERKIGLEILDKEMPNELEKVKEIRQIVRRANETGVYLSDIGAGRRLTRPSKQNYTRL